MRASLGTVKLRCCEEISTQGQLGRLAQEMVARDFAAVMEVDDVVMRTGDDETSTGWCSTLTSMCAVVGSTGSLLDSGSDEHLCILNFADLITTSRDRSLFKLKDVQQNDLVISGQKTVPVLVGPTGGKHAMEATATFRVAEVRDNILSLGKLVRKGSSFNLGPGGCSMEKGGRKVPLMCCSAHRDLDTWRREQLSRMSAMSVWMVWTSKSPIHHRFLAQLWTIS